MKLKRLISLLLVVVMLATLAPVSVFAASGYSTVYYVYSVEAGKHGVTADNQLAYLDGTKAAATDVVPTGTTITLPTVTGFEACGASGTWTYQPTKEVTDTSLTIYYMPANVTYTVNYYFQNMSNGMPQDGYTLKGSTTFTTRSGEKVYSGQWSTLATNTEFFTGSLAEVGTLYNSGNGNYVAPTYDTDMRVAADGSTVVNLYYDCKDYYTVSYNWQGGISGPATELVKTGGKVSPTNPVKPGYTFSGWYTDSSCSNAFSTSTAITQNTQLYAKWLPEKVMVAVWSSYNSKNYLVEAVNAKSLSNGSGTVTLQENKGINTSLALSGYYTYDLNEHMDEYYWKLVGKDSIYNSFDASSQSFINTLSTTVNDIDYLTSRGFYTKSIPHTCSDVCYGGQTFICNKGSEEKPGKFLGAWTLDDGKEGVQRAYVIVYHVGGYNYETGKTVIDNYSGYIFSTKYKYNRNEYYFLYLNSKWYSISSALNSLKGSEAYSTTDSNTNWTVKMYNVNADYPACAPKANGVRVKANYAMAYSSDALDSVIYKNNGLTFANINVTAVTAPSSGTCTLTLMNGSSSAGSASYSYGTTLNNTIASTTPSVPSGYPAGSTFKGWSLSPATYNATLNASSTLTLSTTTMQTSTMTLYAVWELPKGTITAHKADNSTVSSNATDYGWGSGKGAVESYSVSGKKLLYWYYTENSTKKVFDLRTSAVTKSLDIYPMLFESKATPSGSTTYTVNYYVMDANGNSTLAKTVGSKAGTVGATVTEVALKGSELGSAYTNYYPLNTGTNAGASKSIVLGSTADSNVINFYYAAKSIGYTIKYKDASGNPIKDASGNTISDNTTYYAGTDTVTVNKPTVTGYTASPASVTIPLYTRNSGTNEAVFTFTPNTYNINVVCRDANTNAVLEPVDSSSKTVSGAYLSKTTINAPAVSGYFTDDDTNHPATLTDVKFDKADNTKTVTFYYDKLVTVTVNHYQQNVNDNGYTIVSADTETIPNQRAGKEFTATYKSYTGFTAATGENKATPDNNGAVINLHYTRNNYNVTVIRRTENLSGGGYTVYDTPTKTTAKFGSTYTANASSYGAIEGFTAPTSAASGTVTKDGLTLYLDYTRNSYKVTINAVDANGKVLDSKQSDKSYLFGSSQTINAPATPTGYLLDDASSKTVTVGTDTSVSFKYKLANIGYKVYYYKEGTTTSVYDTESATALWDSKLSRTAPYIDGYVLTTGTNRTQEITISDTAANNVITFYYKADSLENKTVIMDYGLNKTVTYDKTLGNVSDAAPAGVTLNTGSTEDDEFDGKTVTGITVSGKTLTVTPGTNMKKTTFYVSAVNSEERYRYASVTVIPASAVYYEDNNSTIEYKTGTWTEVGTTITNIEDYPTAYKNCKTFSMGSAHKTTVSAGNSASAEFTFTGTGFDIISLTDSDSGSIIVSITDKDGKAVGKNITVNNYYGYTYTRDTTNPYLRYVWVYKEEYKCWTVDKSYTGANDKGGVPVPNNTDTLGLPTEKPQNPNDRDKFVTFEVNYVFEKSTATSDKGVIYQVPVIKKTDLAYGTYTVKISVQYSKFFDKTGDDQYDFYLDAVRIYSTKTDGTQYSRAVSDTETGYPEYINLRSVLIGKSAYKTTGNTEGVAIVDGYTDGSMTIEDYSIVGPNNEIYLKNNQALTFNIGSMSNVRSVQLGMKMFQSAGTVEINGDSKNTISTATTSDIYYDITNYITDGSVTIRNAGSSYVSLTTLKIVYKEAKGGASTTSEEAQVMSAADVAYLSAENDIEDDIDTEEYTVFVTPELVAAAKESVLKAMLNEVPTTPEPFVPRLEVLAPEKVTEGEDITLEVSTSDDVAYITVNGVKVETNDDFVWTYTVKAEEVSEMSFEVKAYNAEDEEAENSVTVAVTVEKAPFEPLVNVIVPAAVTVGETVTVQVATSDDVAYITVNGERVDTKDGSVWTYTTTAEAEGELSFVVVAYSEDGEAAEDEKTATVTVSAQPKSTWDIIIDAILGFFKKLLGGK